MPDLLQTGSTWLEDQRHQHMTRPVVYLRGTDSVQLNATVGKTVFEQEDQFGVIQRTESRDYLVRAAELVFVAGEQSLPQVGDRIREPSGTGALVYEVMAPSGGGGEPPFRFSDPERITLRIHTKFVGLEATP